MKSKIHPSTFNNYTTSAHIVRTWSKLLQNGLEVVLIEAFMYIKISYLFFSLNIDKMANIIAAPLIPIRENLSKKKKLIFPISP